MNKIRTAILLVTLIFGVTISTHAQSSLTAENMALGGGGSAYLTGYESLFINPANLFIQEKNYTVQISLFQGGAYFDSALPVTNSYERFKLYRNSFLPYTSPNENRVIDQNQRDIIIDELYPGTRSISTLRSYSDFYWFGMKWMRESRSYAIAFRTRNASTYELGRGYFSSNPVERNNLLEVNQSFRHQYQSLHEISFGYAESFTFLNGLIPRLSEFIVGIAPKVVLAGSYLDTKYMSVYLREHESQNWWHESQFTQKSTGYFSQNYNPAVDNSSEINVAGASLKEILNPSGIGLGLDIGVTYLITFGSDLSTLRREDVPTEKSLRFSFSINDLGAIYHYKTPRQFSSPEMSQERESTGALTEQYYQGAPNEHISFLNQFEDSPFGMIEEITEGSFNTLMPTSVNVGALFQINRLKLMGDIRYGLSNNSFITNTPVIHTGIEIRPLPFLPLRAGTRIAPHLPGFYSFGSGIETSYFDISVAVQLKSGSIGPTTEFLAASLVGIKFYIP